MVSPVGPSQLSTSLTTTVAANSDKAGREFRPRCGRGNGDREDGLKRFIRVNGITAADIESIRKLKFGPGERAVHAAQRLSEVKNLKPAIKMNKFYKIAKIVLVTSDGYSLGGDWAVTRERGAGKPVPNPNGNNYVSDEQPAPWYKASGGKRKRER